MGLRCCQSASTYLTNRAVKEHNVALSPGAEKKSVFDVLVVSFCSWLCYSGIGSFWIILGFMELLVAPSLEV